MIPLRKALELVTAWNVPPRIETAPLREAAGRIIPASLLSPMDSPPFDKSAMDGYAIGTGDVRESYRIAGTLAAGGFTETAIEPGTCLKIMTGAPLPPGAERVQRFEYAEERDSRMYPTRPESVPNIIRKGENLKAGEILLTPRRLRPEDIGILAAAGIAEVPVSVRPRVSVITTGSEIVPAGAPLSAGRIYDSNGPQLASQAAQAGCVVTAAGPIPDDAERLREAIEAALASSDILILSGGVSMGEFDLVPAVLRAAGVDAVFHSVAVKPGKPVFFGRKGACTVFGLPGNPVSTYIIFNVLVIPFIGEWQGLPTRHLEVSLPLAREVTRRDSERTEFIPVSVTAKGAMPIIYHGSSHLNAYAEADGFIMIPAGTRRIETGVSVDVRFPGLEPRGAREEGTP